MFCFVLNSLAILKRTCKQDCGQNNRLNRRYSILSVDLDTSWHCFHWFPVFTIFVLYTACWLWVCVWQCSLMFTRQAPLVGLSCHSEAKCKVCFFWCSFVERIWPEMLAACLTFLFFTLPPPEVALPTVKRQHKTSSVKSYTVSHSIHHDASNILIFSFQGSLPHIFNDYIYIYTQCESIKTRNRQHQTNHPGTKVPHVGNWSFHICSLFCIGIFTCPPLWHRWSTTEGGSPRPAHSWLFIFDGREQSNLHLTALTAWLHKMFDILFFGNHWWSGLTATDSNTTLADCIIFHNHPQSRFPVISPCTGNAFYPSWPV